jgi:hypothetical protein
LDSEDNKKIGNPTTKSGRPFKMDILKEDAAADGSYVATATGSGLPIGADKSSATGIAL